MAHGSDGPEIQTKRTSTRERHLAARQRSTMGQKAKRWENKSLLKKPTTTIITLGARHHLCNPSSRLGRKIKSSRPAQVA